MKLTYVLIAMFPLAACSNAVQPGADGSVDVAADTVSTLDTGHADVPPRADTGPFMCGTATCNPGQFCLSTAGGAGIQMSCRDIPVACGSGAITCECLGSVCPIDTHHSCSVADLNADCSCNDCP